MLPSDLVLVTAISYFVSAVQAATYCNATSSCPEDLPCCNQYGECGTGSYCLGGCHPAYSYDIDACMPMPICKNLTYTFDDKDDILSIDDWLGDADEADWVYSGYLEDYDDAEILAMPNGTSGTVVSSTFFVWYGKISATFKTSRGNGVVSAFIMFSNSQDEIDWEFVGYNLTSVETNFYYEAVLNYTNVEDIDLSNTFSNYHTYELDWQEDHLDWILDGEVVRTLEKEDTWNETTESYHYPQTPSRIQFSLWPAGDSDSSGTVEWAGGEVDWNSEDMEDYGYYYYILKNATVECYDPPSGTLVNGSSAYVFNSSTDFDQEYVMVTNDNTILCDSDSSGIDNDEECVEDSTDTDTSSDTATESGSTTSSDDSTETGSTTAKKTSTKKTSSTTSTIASEQYTEFFQNYGGSSTTGSSNIAMTLASTPAVALLAGILSYIVIL